MVIFNKKLLSGALSLIVVSIQGLAMEGTFSGEKFKKPRVEQVPVPIAQPQHTVRFFHNNTFQLRDDFAWLRDSSWKNATDGVKDPKILDYLKREEDYTEAFLTQMKPIIEDYVQKRLAMIPESKDSYPVLEDGYFYFTRTSNKLQYPIHFRYGKDQSKEEAVAYFDENKESAGHDFFDVGELNVSPNGQLLAYAVDAQGDEHFVIRVRDLFTGVESMDVIKDTTDEIVWAPNNRGFYYVWVNERDRPTSVFFHALGQTQDMDRHVYTEADDALQMGIGTTTDERYLLIHSNSKDESFIQGIDLAAYPAHELRTIVQSKPRRLAQIDHKNGSFYLRINDKGPNRRLVRTPVSQVLNESAWSEVLPTNPDYYMTDFQALDKGIAFELQGFGVRKLGLYDDRTNTFRYILLPGKTYHAELFSMPYKAESLRFTYSSLAQPSSVHEADFETLKPVVRQVSEIPSGHNPDDFITDLLFIKARDGKEVPVSLVYKKGRYVADGTRPLLLYAYGAYGASTDPQFREWIQPFLDYGFAYAIAHVRGGTEMGYSWYLDGKMHNKEKTFYDYIDVSNALIERKYTAKGNILALGGSAGGLLMGAIANMAPDLYKGIIFLVPYLDAVNTMLDSSLALVPPEYTEWGNPAADPKVFAQLLGYSPYDNLSENIRYPAMFITGGVYDARVNYWEMTKYVAKLRHVSPDTKVWLRMITTGHGGGTALKDQLREDGEMFAFALKVFGFIGENAN